MKKEYEDPNPIDAQYVRQRAKDQAWDAIWKVLNEHDLAPEQVDLVLLDLISSLLFSATLLQRKAALVQELNLPIDEVLEKLRKLEIPPEYFRGVREV